MSATLSYASSRNQRNKGFKAKHVLQICLLLAVCVWLLYQIKHSHNKKKSYDNLKTANNLDNTNEMKKFGRKDLNQGDRVTSENTKLGDGEENEEKEDKHEQRNDRDRGDGNNEMDENDEEKVDKSAEHGEEFFDGIKEAKEENEGREENNNLIENVGSSENHDQGVEERNSQEAREEHYKADDASNAVIRENQVVNTAVTDKSLGNSVEEQLSNAGENNVENDIKTNVTDNKVIEEEDSMPNLVEIDVPFVSGERETNADSSSDDNTIGDKDAEAVKEESFSHTYLEESISQVNSTLGALDGSSSHSSNQSTLDHNTTFEASADDGENSNSSSLDLERSANSSMTSGETHQFALEQTEMSNTDAQPEESSNIQFDQRVDTIEQSENSDNDNAVYSNRSVVVEDVGKSNATTETEETQNAASKQTNVEGFHESKSQKGEDSNAAIGVDASDDNPASSTASNDSVAVTGESFDSSSSLVIHEEKMQSQI